MLAPVNRFYIPNALVYSFCIKAKTSLPFTLSISKVCNPLFFVSDGAIILTLCCSTVCVKLLKTNYKFRINVCSCFNKTHNIMSRLLIGLFVSQHLGNIIWISSIFSAYQGQLHLISFLPYCQNDNEFHSRVM